MLPSVSPDASLAFALSLCGRWPRATACVPRSLLSDVMKLPVDVEDRGAWMAAISCLAGVGMAAGGVGDVGGPSPSSQPLCLSPPSAVASFPVSVPSAAILGRGGGTEGSSSTAIGSFL